MPYVANKNKLNLGGKIYAKGDVLTPATLKKIPERRMDALLRTRIIREAEQDEIVVKGDMCMYCEDGPFQRLAQHVSLKHEDILLGEVDGEGVTLDVALAAAEEE